jgi:DNA modification methylase
MSAPAKNKLYYGDNLEVMRQYIPDESVDLVYLDPPFNSNRSYNVIFGKNQTVKDAAAAQIQAFNDAWRWTPVTEGQYERYAVGGELPERVGDALTAFRTLLGENDAMAYLVNMAPRLVQLYRVLKPTGSLYLHCDPTMSHYLKILLDAIFGANRFVNEIIWKRSSAHSDSAQGSRHYGRIHDTILFYARDSPYKFNTKYVPYDQTYIESHYRYVEEGTGRRYRKGDLTAAKPGGDTLYEWKGVHPYTGRYWAYSREKMEEFDKQGRLVYTKTGMPEYKRYLDEMPGNSLQDVWTDIDAINPMAVERLNYPTQKPISLLERILSVSSDEGDVVLDPFCGCGTAVDAAQKLGRQWIGIDITYIAIDLIENRLQDRYPDIAGTYEAVGIPRDLQSAKALFGRSPFDFERWAVSRLNARPNEKQTGDKGIDGVARFHLDKKTTGKVLVSVKGGTKIGPDFLRDLLGTVQTQKAQMGVLILMTEPTRGIHDAADHGGTYTWPINGQTFPRVQVITVGELLKGKRPQVPTLIPPYVAAVKSAPESVQLGFDDLGM